MEEERVMAQDADHNASRQREITKIFLLAVNARRWNLHFLFKFRQAATMLINSSQDFVNFHFHWGFN